MTRIERIPPSGLENVVEELLLRQSLCHIALELLLEVDRKWIVDKLADLKKLKRERWKDTNCMLVKMV